MVTSSAEPVVIQGGMGVAVSSWPLASAVARTGQLGVIAGTALDVVLARRLQLGDLDGDARRAMAEFPKREIVDRILDRYYIPGGKDPEAPFLATPMAAQQPARDHLELLVVSNFVEVYLAKQGHEGVVGINFLEKIQLPLLPSLFGAILAGVDYVLMGAGIPRAIPGVLDRLCRGEQVEIALDVEGASRDESFLTTFDPAAFWGGDPPQLHRPRFLAIVASATLATMLARKASGRVDGFVVEGPSAGGHNAPPRGEMQLNDQGEPVYGKRDVPDLGVFRKLERPFWLAGSYGTAERLAEALAAGATGIQVGTAFAFCRESGMLPDIKRDVLERVRQGTAHVRTDPAASPTGFPFKIIDLPGSMSEEDSCDSRNPVCDLGYLRHAYSTGEGTLGWRCAAENVDSYLRKGGEQSDTVGRKCICNALAANVGLGQIRKDGQPELPLITCGDDVVQIASFLPTPEAQEYSAEDVISHLLLGVQSSAAQG